MSNKKIKILYDARLLVCGVQKDSGRSGIYFTILNVLKSLLKNNRLEITLYATKNEINNIKKILKREFPNKHFKILIFNNISPKTTLDTFFYILSEDSSLIKKLFFKTVYAIFCIPNFIKQFIQICHLKCYRGYNAIFSAALAIPDCFKYISNAKKYLFLHDITPIILNNFYGHNHGNDWFYKMVNSLNGEDYYFTNSEYTRQDFLKYFPQINPNKITNTYVGCNVEYSPQPNLLDKVKTKYNIPKDKKYLFSLCTLEPRKNLIRIIKTFSDFTKKNNIDDLILVMGGGCLDSFQKKFEKELENINSDKILKIGYVDDEDLPILYSGAEWFTYTSRYEGFGSPVLEAMNCGCPVITSNNTSLPEVIGDAGIQIDWDSDEQHIQAYEQYYYNENLRKENSRKGRERAQKFSWDKTVDRIVGVITETSN